MKKYGVLVLGVAAVIGGGVLWASGTATANATAGGASFGWFAYAPTSGSVYPPESSARVWLMLAAGLAGVGLVLIAGWTGYGLGRRPTL